MRLKKENSGRKETAGFFEQVSRFARYSVLAAGIALSGCCPCKPVSVMDAGSMQDSKTAADAGIPDSRAPDTPDSFSADTKPPGCQTPTVPCSLKAPPASGTYTVVDDSDGKTYTSTATTIEENGTVRVKVAFEPALEQCSTVTDGLWNKCGWPKKCDDDDNLFSYSKAAHRMTIRFFGEDYRISDMSLDDPYGSPNRLALAKSSASGILNISESLQAGGYKIRLDEIGMGPCAVEQPARLSYFDCHGEKLNKEADDLIVGNVLYKTLPDGARLMIQAIKVAPGYTFGAKWADLQVLGSIVYLQDGMAPVLISPGLGTPNATDFLKDWKAQVKSDGLGRLLWIELSAPAGSKLKTC